MCNENWIKSETLSEYKKAALKAVAKQNKQNEGKKFKTVRIDAKTVKIVEVE